MYFVLTVCELIRLNKETGLLDRIQVETLRVFAVFLDGLDIIEMGFEVKDAST